MEFQNSATLVLNPGPTKCQLGIWDASPSPSFFSREWTVTLVLQSDGNWKMRPYMEGTLCGARYVANAG